MTFRFQPDWLPNGIQTLDGEDLLLLVSDAPYSDSVVTADDIASTEVADRVTCVGATLREETGWQLGLDDLGDTTLTADGLSYYLVRDAATDADRLIVGGDDQLIPTGLWEPSFDDGALFLPFASRTQGETLTTTAPIVKTGTVLSLAIGDGLDVVDDELVATGGGGGGDLPGQTGNDGKILRTDGTDPSWTDLGIVIADATAKTTPVGGDKFVMSDSDDSDVAKRISFDDLAAAIGGGKVPASLVDAKGDLLVGTADNTIARLAVGADGLPLIADPTAPAGVAFNTPTTQRGFYRDNQSYGLSFFSSHILGTPINCTPGANKILWWDIVIVEPIKIDAQWLYSQTTNTGAKGWPGIWAKDPATGQPTGLPLVTGAEIALTSTAYRSDTFTKSDWIMPGVYSVGWATNDGTAGIRPVNLANSIPVVDVGGAAGSTIGNLSWTSTWTYSSSALPDVTSHTFVASTTIPSGFIRWRIRRS